MYKFSYQLNRGMKSKANGWTTKEEEEAAQIAYDDELVRRYQGGMVLSSIDRREARKIIKHRMAKLNERNSNVAEPLRSIINKL